VSALSIVIAGCDGAARSDVAQAQAATAPARAVPRELPAVLAHVNGEAVEGWELEAALREIAAMAEHPIPASQRDEIARTVLDRIIGHHLVAQAARRDRLVVSDAEVDADVARMRQEAGTEAEFNELLAAFRLTLDQLRRQRRLSLEVARFMEARIAPSVSVRADQVDAYYRENVTEFQQPEAVRASHILVRTLPDSTPEQVQAARGRAERVAAQLRAGRAFDELAREVSEDRGSASGGGALGWLARGDMPPAFEDAAFAQPAGEWTGPVETLFGLHLVKTLERRPARPAPLDEVRRDIERRLTEQVRHEKLAAFVEQARATATVAVYI
jgi:parvulin-like peptidyl-prolyl isomerase